MGALPAYTRLGWWWDKLGTGLGPFPGCGTLTQLCPCLQTPSRAELRQLTLPTLLALRSCTLPTLAALPAWPWVPSWGTCSAVCQTGSASSHTTTSALGPRAQQSPSIRGDSTLLRVGFQEPRWAQGWGRLTGVHCRAPGEAPQHVPATCPPSPGLPFLPSLVPCLLPALPPGPHTVCHACHHGKGEISSRPSAPAPSH